MCPRAIIVLTVLAACCAPLPTRAQSEAQPPDTAQHTGADSARTLTKQTSEKGLGLLHIAPLPCDTTQDRKRWLPKGRGNIEVGTIYGTLPFTMDGAAPWNGFAKGTIGMDVRGVPIAIAFDLGTDQLQRGQRNTVRFLFDAPRMLDKQSWSDAHQLHASKSVLDSLETQQGALTRQAQGQQAWLVALQAAAAERAVQDSLLQWTQRPRAPPPLTAPFVVVDTTDTLGTLLADPALPTSIGTKFGDAVSPDPLLPRPSSPLAIPTNYASSLDSLQDALANTQQQLHVLDTLVAQQRMQQARLTAVVNATQGKEGLVTQFAKGIRRLEVGTCSPSSSTFLINGINFQGLSFEFAHKDLFFALDKGRSFDDTWVNNDPVASDLRRLSQSLFLADAQDLNPRKLTAVRAGFGQPDGTHAHVGYLHGLRDDLPLGVVVDGTPAVRSVNHVIEIDLAYQIRKQHQLRVVYARSLVQGGNTAGEDGVRTPLSDLLSAQGNKDEAVKLRWTTDLPKTKTRVELEGRTTDPYFQSFGLGFIRNGSKAGEVRLDQQLGERLRLRARAVLEERKLPNNDPGEVQLQRGHLSLNYRASRAVVLRAAVNPVQVRTMANDALVGTSTNGSYSIGGDIRKRWRKTTLTVNMDGALYKWSSSIAPAQQVVNNTLGLGLERGDRWRLRSTWSRMRPLEADTVPASENLTVQLGYRNKKGTTMDASVQIPSGFRLGWSLSIRQAIGDHFAICLQAERFARANINFLDDRTFQQISAYNCSVALQYQW